MDPANINPYQAPNAPLERRQQNQVIVLEHPDASRWKRFFNYLIDLVVYQLIAEVVIQLVFQSGLFDLHIEILETQIYGFLIAIAVMVAYYAILEYSFGASIGKLITGTRVITSNGEPLGIGQIVGRSFARLIPFELFSFFGTKPRGWHDSLSQTLVVDVRKPQQQRYRSELF
ncbi:MAG: RDD family protein [Verrucomicrobiales bacterium]|nr:RDD family protein [Verrucomicrobiales bacterium]